MKAFLLANLFSAIAASAQLIPAAKLQEDAAVLCRAYGELHPGLYRYNTKAEIDSKCAALRTEFSRDRSLQEAYLAFSLFAAQLKCGHSYANFFNQEKPVAEALFKGQTRVPFYFRWLDRRMVVTQDFTPDHAFPRGTEIFSINGAPVRSVLEKLLTVARADGSNDAKRIALLELNGESVYETFDVFFPMFFPQKSAALKILAQRPGETKPGNIDTVALTYDQRIAPIQAREANRNGGAEPFFEWKYLANGSAYLGMPNWAVFNSKWDWKTWLNAKLDQLSDKNPPALVVDLRGNEGGNDVGDEILKRLATTEIRLPVSRRLVRYRQTPADLNPYLDTWDPSFKNWGAAAVELDRPWPTAPPAHYFALTKYDDDAAGADIIRPSGKPFRGKVFVLIDANNSSATFQFAQVVQQSKFATLVGQLTGGNQRGINGGAFFFLRLPNSRIELDIPLIGGFPATLQPDTGLTPDIPVTPSLRDIVAGTDVELARVAELIRK